MTRVLLIDDDATVRSALREMLLCSNYEVIETADGSNALSLYEKNEIDIIITDLVMPHKDGLQTILELKELHPQVKIIAMSAGMPDANYSAKVLLPLAKGAGACSLLNKPCTLDELLETLSVALTQQP